MFAARVKEELRRRGVADVMVFMETRRAGKSRRGRRKPIDIDPGELGRSFIADERSFVVRSGARAAAKRCEPSIAPKSHFRYFPHLGIAVGTIDEAAIRDGRAALPIAHVVAPLAVSPIRPTMQRQIAQPTQPVTWGIQALNIEPVWDQGFTGQGVRIGHVDTGVDDGHPALAGAVENFALIDDYGDVDPYQNRPFDAEEHGTHTAATMAGRASGGYRVGVAPGALLQSVCVLEGGAATSRVLNGMDWAISKGAKILNVSLGVRGYDENFLPLTRRLRETGILPVFAVGNEGQDTSRSPGNYDEAVSVGAIDRTLATCPFSSYAQIETTRTVPDLVAPGEEIESALTQGGYQVMSGTSMAAPHISGLAALLWEAAPEATEDEIEAAIFQSCRKPPGGYPASYGFGYPDAAEALRLILR